MSIELVRLFGSQISIKLAVLQAAKEKQVILKKSRSPDKQAIAANQAAIEQQYTEISKLFDKATLTGGHLKNATAQARLDESWEVAIEFDDFGSNAFAKLTKNLAGTGRSSGIFLDNDPINQDLSALRKNAPDRIKITKLLYLLCKNSELF